MDIRKLLEDPTGQQVIAKRPVGTKVLTGAMGTVKRVTAAQRTVVVVFDQDPGVEHTMERIDVELVPPVRKESPPMPPPGEMVEELSVTTPRSPSDDDVDEL